MKKLIILGIILLILPVLAWSQPTSWTSIVVGVSDGDTITVMHLNKIEKIRLYGIDCPEKEQAFGKRAKQFTSNMVFGKKVEISPITLDKYKRTIARVYIAGKCLSEELLKVGLAWHYKCYSPDEHLSEIETTARHTRLGLWSQQQPIAPWNFRQGKKKIINPELKA